MVKNRNVYPRIYKPLQNKTYFLFGPRGTGKTTWLKSQYPRALFVNLLDSATFLDLKSDPSRIRKRIGKLHEGLIIIDEVQRVPEILNDVHALIEENKKLVFILTGSSARSLRRSGINLLAGRALRRNFYPLTKWEMGEDFDLKKALQNGLLPMAVGADNPQDFLKSYVHTYLKEEISAEGVLTQIEPFVRFLEVISFSQGQILNFSAIGREVGVDPKTVKNYISILEDLLIAETLPVFSKRAKRRLSDQLKFFLFDSGVFHSLRPKGVLDSTSEIAGPALETLFWHHHRVLVESLQIEQKLYFWKTQKKQEVDFVSYGEKGLFGFEIKLSSRNPESDLKGLELFQNDYPSSQCFCLYGGDKKFNSGKIQIIPFMEGLDLLKSLFG
jgi:predicted AAA+ superfamily ATPase